MPGSIFHAETHPLRQRGKTMAAGRMSGNDDIGAWKDPVVMLSLRGAEMSFEKLTLASVRARPVVQSYAEFW